jgi:F-type H+-transporting ATPase subunit b
MLDFDITIFVVFVIVWVLVIALSRVFFKPLTRIIDKRRAQIEGDNSAAREALEKYERDIRRIEDSLKEAKAASQNIREKAEIEAFREKSRLVQAVQAEGRSQVERAKKELEEKIEELKKELEAKTGDLAEEIEKRLMN